MKKNKFNFWWLIIPILIVPSLLGVAIPLGILYLVFSSIGKQKQKTTSTTKPFNPRVSQLTPTQREKIHLALKKYFENNDRLIVTGDINLRPLKGEYTSIRELLIYEVDDCVATLDDFQGKYRDLYDGLMELLIEFANIDEIRVVKSEPVIVEPVIVEERAKAKNEYDNAQEYMDHINQLNTEIPHEEISNGLYQTCSYLKHIGIIEKNFPKSKSKLKKVYQYYLPILIDILENYRQFQDAGQGNEEFLRAEDKLIKTTILINEALKTISNELCQEELMDLNANMSTLEMLLHSDGLIEENTLKAVKGKGDANG